MATKATYPMKSPIGQLYFRITNETKEIIDRGEGYKMPGSDPRLDDIIIEHEGKKLVGITGESGLIYKWYHGENWATASFKTPSQIIVKNEDEYNIKHKELVDVLENHYGKGTERRDFYAFNNLEYDIVDENDEIIGSIMLGIDALTIFIEKNKRSIFSFLKRHQK